MNEIILASHNENKVKEFRQIFSSKKIISLNDIGFEKEIEETGFTLEQNALIKVREVFNFSHRTAISDDSGLEIDFLDGEPGVFSARYSGLNARPIDNINKVLIYPEKSRCMNLAFDVTPAKYVTGLITEKGVCEASTIGLKQMFKR